MAPLRASPTMRRLAGAFMVNELGDGIAVMLFPLVVERATGSGLLVGLAFAVTHASSFVGLPVGGVLADRLDRHRVLRWSFVVRATLLLLAIAADRPVVTICCLLAAGLGGSIDNPSAESAIRELAGDRVQQVATIRKVVRAVSGVVGLAIGAVSLELLGIRAALAVDAATFVIALFVMPRGPAGSWQARPQTRSAVRTSARFGRAVAMALQASLADARAGLAHLGSHRDLRLTASSGALLGGAVSALLATVVVWFATLPGASDGAYSWSLAAYSGGSVTALVLAGMVAWRVRLAQVVTRTLVVSGGVCALAVVGRDWRMVALSWLLWGVVSAPYDIITDAAVVRATPAGLLGRAYAGLALAGTIGQVIGGVVAGALADVVPPPMVILGLGALLAVAGVASWSTSRRGEPSVASPR